MVINTEWFEGQHWYNRMTGEYGVYFPCAGPAHHLRCRIGPQGRIQDACMLGGLEACPSPGFFWEFHTL